jgi:hypothetical protein
LPAAAVRADTYAERVCDAPADADHHRHEPVASPDAREGVGASAGHERSLMFRHRHKWTPPEDLGIGGLYMTICTDRWCRKDLLGTWQDLEGAGAWEHYRRAPLAAALRGLLPRRR